MRAVLAGLLMAGAALAVARRQRLGTEPEILVAVLRAGLQLAVVALVIDTAFDHLGYSAVFVLVMLGAATWTAGRRLEGVSGRYRIGGLAIVAGAGPALLLIFGSGAYPMDPQYLIPIAGILIGGAMTASTLAGRRIRDEMAASAAEIEARLSLGVTAKFALRSYLPRSIHSALIPVIDQTRNVGLITLPGAFVGMILGGASPGEAARVQLMVLLSLLGVQALSAAACATWVALSFVAPGERLALPEPAATRGRGG